MINWVYRTWMQSAVTKLAMDIIRIFDYIGFEVHFVRFVYWSFIDSVEGNPKI